MHNRPLFRPEDWAQYRAVNEKFAAAVLEEIVKAVETTSSTRPGSSNHHE